MRVDESCQVRVFMRVFSTLVPRSNESKSCMRVAKRDIVREFSQFSCPGQTRTRVARHSMSVGYILPDKRAQTLINFHQNLNELKVDESWRSNASECCNSHQFILV